MIVRLSLVKQTHYSSCCQFQCQYYIYVLFSAELYVAFDQRSTSVVEGDSVASVYVSADTSLTEIPIRVLLISSDGTATGEL